MGSCFDKQGGLEEPTSLLLEKKRTKNKKNNNGPRSGLLQSSISKEVIMEEDSKIVGSYVSALSLD